MFGISIPMEGAADRVAEWTGMENDYQRQRRIQLEQQRQMDYNASYQGITGKVEAAKAMGLHPLAALGSTTGGGGSAGFGATGQIDFQSSPPPETSRPEDPTQKRYNEARARQAEAQATLAELEVTNANNRLAKQPGNAPVMTPDGADITTAPADTYTARHAFKYEPQEIPTSRPRDATTTAGPHQPFSTEYLGRDVYGNPVRLKALSQNASEGTEGMGEIAGTVMSLPMMIENMIEMFWRTPQQMLSQENRLRDKDGAYLPPRIKGSPRYSPGRFSSGKVK